MANELEKQNELTENEVSQGMNETATGKRKITIDGLGDLVMKHPSRDDELEADAERSKAFTRFLLDGLKTESEMTEIAEERGLWTEKDEKDLEKIQQDMVKNRLDSSQEKAGTKKKKLDKELAEIRQSLMKKITKKNAIFSHTVESKANNIWWQHLVFRCVYKEDGETKCWERYSDFSKELNNGPTAQLVADFITFYNGLSDDFFDLWQGEVTKLPESGEPDGE